MALDEIFGAIEKQLDDKLPFVAYHKPNALELKALVQDDDALHTIMDYSESGFVFAPFDNTEVTILIPVNAARSYSVSYDLGDLVIPKGEAFDMDHKSELSQSKKDKEFHINCVKQGIEAIRDDSFSKVVLARRETISKVKSNPLDIFRRLLSKYAGAFVYVWYHPKVGMWLGATPETLISVNGNLLKTMALAGTQAYHAEENVVWKEKELEEQQIVTDFIVEQLNSLEERHTNKEISTNADSKEHNLFVSRPLNNSNSVVTVSETKTSKAGNLLHLLTEITMKLRPDANNLKPILEALHPTPAVCGFPKENAKAYILGHERHPREFYAGFLGELNLKQSTSRNTNRRNVENNAYRVQKSVTNLYVNLRCMQLKNDKAYIYVGGGITKDSNPTAEWEETVHKSKIIKSVL